MNTEYHNSSAVITPNARRYRGISYTTPINAAKEAVEVIDLADRLAGPGKMRRVGKNLTTNCLLPEHEDRVPSFVVYPDTNSWFCHGCLRGGDVVELARLAWGYDQRDAHIVAGYLLLEFGHEVPERPPAFYRKQERQALSRDAIERTRKNIYLRRLFRHLILPVVDAIEDEAERNRELERAWAEFQRFLP